jgi:hypothetical protein
MQPSTPWRWDPTLAHIPLCKPYPSDLAPADLNRFSASLAGLLWRTILGQKGRTVKAVEFYRYNWIAVIITMIVGCLIVAGEVCVIY